ncbi:alpha/beta hydrolase [Bradyrhizobium sp. Pear76]|uniref:alpha/beta hydrolase n=1 Tax=Bradyrhizobium oropedii TaxID=1571201 RepID=UPI001E5CD520|nr:alpha/beta hydrolase [Bradyrhizobium oropedii]MCC8961386.1 alpha/beta hydrolase [Bradyrhizobium oropedii]
MGLDATKKQHPSIIGPGMPATLRARQLDREASLLLRATSSLVGQPISHERVDKFRRSWRLLAVTYGRRVPVASIVEHKIDSPAGEIILRVYTPKGPTGLKPAFLWCHGGGFVVGDLDSNDSICRGVAHAAQAIVVAVRYRLAPEHDLYAGRDDFLAALNWVASHGASIGVDSSLLAIGGDSAGGNIAAAVTQENLRRGGQPVQLQVLVYPATDLLAEFASKTENGNGYFLTADFIDSLLPLIEQGKDLTDPWISPARNSDLRGLPPALIVTAGFDPIRDDGLSYAAQLRKAGVPVELLHYPGQFHGFLNFDSIIGAARDALSRMGTSLGRAFRNAPPVDCSTEISDQAPVPWLRPQIPTELLTAALLVGRSMRQFSSTTARWLSPEIASAAECSLLPWWLPVALMRRALTAYLNLPAAHQTYPSGLDASS